MWRESTKHYMASALIHCQEWTIMGPAQTMVPFLAALWRSSGQDLFLHSHKLKPSLVFWETVERSCPSPGNTLSLTNALTMPSGHSSPAGCCLTDTQQRSRIILELEEKAGGFLSPSSAFLCLLDPQLQPCCCQPLAQRQQVLCHPTHPGRGEQSLSRASYDQGQAATMLKPDKWEHRDLISIFLNLPRPGKGSWWWQPPREPFQKQQLPSRSCTPSAIFLAALTLSLCFADQHREVRAP